MSDTDRDAFVHAVPALEGRPRGASPTRTHGRSRSSPAPRPRRRLRPDHGWTRHGGHRRSPAASATETTVRVDTAGTAVVRHRRRLGLRHDRLHRQRPAERGEREPTLTDLDAALTDRPRRPGGRRRPARPPLRRRTPLKYTSVTLEARRAGIEDIDLAKAVLDLQLQQTNLPGSPRRHREGPAADPDGLPPMSTVPPLTFTVPPFGLEPLAAFVPRRGRRRDRAVRAPSATARGRARLFLLDAARAPAVVLAGAHRRAGRRGSS